MGSYIVVVIRLQDTADGSVYPGLGDFASNVVRRQVSAHSQAVFQVFD